MKNGCEIHKDEAAARLFIENKHIFENACGEQIFITLESFIDPYDKDDDPDVIILLITNKQGKPISIFYGTMEDGILSSDITCSSELKNGGTLLRYYALLIANELNPEITEIKGAISGGIPPQLSTDSVDVITQKTERLYNYHRKNGAIIEGNIFTYKLLNIKNKIKELFTIVGGKRKRKTKRRRNNKRHTNKRVY